MPKHEFAVAASGLPVTFKPLTPSLRARIEATIENLIALLDVIDGDADCEEDDPAEYNGDEMDCDTPERFGQWASERVSAERIPLMQPDGMVRIVIRHQ